MRSTILKSTKYEYTYTYTYAFSSSNLLLSYLLSVCLDLSSNLWSDLDLNPLDLGSTSEPKFLLYCQTLLQDSEVRQDLVSLIFDLLFITTFFQMVAADHII